MNVSPKGGLRMCGQSEQLRVAGFHLVAFVVVFAAPACLCANEATNETLRILVLRGEGFVNNAKKRVAREPIVEVRDRNNRPVAGATVSFLLPTAGPGGSFSNGSTIFRIFTNAKGRAIASGFRPNSIGGAFKINITAAFQGQAGTAAITQTNVAAAI